MFSKTRFKRTLVISLVVPFAAVSLMGAGLTPAVGGVNDSEKISSLISRVAPDRGNVELNGNLSLNPETPVEVAGENGAVLDIKLPQNLGLGLGEKASDGTVVFHSKNNKVDAAVQVLDNGSLRAQTIINDPTASHEFSYGVGERFQPVQAPDGSFWTVGFSESGEYQAFSIDDAWARDANGNSVSTHYEIRGNELVQIVEPAQGAAYPIVADPTWQWYKLAYGAGFSKAETRNIAASGGVAAACGFVPLPLAPACAILGISWFTQASQAANANGCVFIAAVPAPIAVRWLSPECR